MKTHQRDVQSRPGESEHTRYGMLKERRLSRSRIPEKLYEPDTFSLEGHR